MKEKLESLLQDGITRINATKTETELQEVKGSLLGKQGAVTLLMKEMGKIPAEERPVVGQLINRVKNAFFYIFFKFFLCLSLYNIIFVILIKITIF